LHTTFRLHPLDSRTERGDAAGAGGARLMSLLQCNTRPDPVRWLRELFISVLVLSSGACGRSESPPEDMVRVEGGSVSGLDGSAAGVEPFYLDRLPVSVASYRRAALAGDLPLPDLVEQLPDDVPMVALTQDQAASYCALRGARLPTDAEWTMAAAGASGRSYPWGEGWDSQRLRMDTLELTVIGEHPEGASPEGVEDIVGNAFQHSSTTLRFPPDAVVPRELLGSTFTVLRGGCCSLFPGWNRSSLRIPMATPQSSSWVGFRCAHTSTPGVDPNRAADRYGHPATELFSFGEAERQLIGDLIGPGRVERYPPELEAALAEVPIGAVVADVGSGIGYATMRMVEQVGTEGLVYAVDIDPGVLEVVAARAQARGLDNVRTVHSQPGDIGLEAGHIDELLLLNVVGFVPPTRALRFVLSCVRALAPGGRLVVWTPGTGGDSAVERALQLSGLQLEREHVIVESVVGKNREKPKAVGPEIGVLRIFRAAEAAPVPAPGER